jgi:hypothetical protein
VGRGGAGSTTAIATAITTARTSAAVCDVVDLQTTKNQLSVKKTHSDTAPKNLIKQKSCEIKLFEDYSEINSP